MQEEIEQKVVETLGEEISVDTSGVDVNAALLGELSIAFKMTYYDSPLKDIQRHLMGIVTDIGHGVYGTIEK